MKHILLQDDVQAIEARLKHFENKTGCDLLLIVAQSSDPYPAASWRFGIISSFLINLVFSYYFEFHHAYLWPVSFLVITLLMVWVGGFPWAKRLTLSSWEVQRESLEKAVEYFHTLGTSKSSHKVTAMIMVSVLEKQIHVLIDEKLKEKITQAELDDLIIIMQTHFKAGNMGLGFTQSIESLENKILLDFGGPVSSDQASELSDTIHFL